MTEHTRTETDALAEAILEANSPEHVHDAGGNPRYLKFPTETIDLEPLEPRPHHHRGDTRLDNVSSFASWIQDHQVPAHQAAIYADRANGQITAVLDDHEPDRPGWRRYRAYYPVDLSTDWLHWKRQISGAYFAAVGFAEQIEDYAHLITAPPTADLYDMVRNFRATRRSTFRDEIDDSSGDRALQWTTETDTGELIIPERITLTMPIYDGAAPFGPIDARFRYRIEDGAARFGVRIIGPDAVERAAFEELAEDVAKAVAGDIPIYLGNPESVEGL